jgi:hypothetical protein
MILPNDPRGYEAAYRRGFHQAIVLCHDLGDEAFSHAEARLRLDRAEELAGEYRSQSRHPGRPPLADMLRERLGRRRQPALDVRV